MNSPTHARNRCDIVKVCFRLLGGLASKPIMQKDPNRRGPTPKVSCAGYSLLRCMYLSSKIILSTYLGASTNRVTLALQELSDALKIEATCLLSMLRETVTEMDSLKVCAHCHKPAWVCVKLYISPNIRSVQDEEQYLHRMTQHYQNQIDTFKQKQTPSS